jgi:20S proteasome alpha/beta subunit
VRLKPPSLPWPNLKRLPKVGAMTIAIGYLCHRGIVVAADTAIVIPPSQLMEGKKLVPVWGRSGNFAIANSSEDGHATATLEAEFINDLEAAEIRDYRQLSGMFKLRMTEWSTDFGARTPPSMQFIVGAKLLGKDPKLFFCEPPNTVREMDDYAAAGSGSSVTDSLYAALFGNNGGDHTDVQVVLRRVSYLIYRAKKDDVYCGKNTDCVVVSDEHHGVIELESDDMTLAERYSQDVDFVVSGAALFSTGSDDSSIERDSLDLADMLKEGNLRKMEFHDRAGWKISF